MPAPTKDDILFGRVAIQNKLVSQDQVRECLGLMQKNGAEGAPESLGKFLVAKGYLSPAQFREISQRLQQQAAAAEAEAGGASEAPAKPVSGRRVPVVTASEVLRMDFSHLASKPLDSFLETARGLGASDLHFHVDSPPFIRLHGRQIYLKHPTLEPSVTQGKCFELLRGFEKSVLEKRKDVDFCHEAPHGRYRANVYQQRKGIDAVFRVIPDHVPTLEELGLPDILRQFTKYRQGLVLITGPAGCGKSATMASLVDIINREQHDHIITVEDPIEYIIESKNCNVNQRHVRVHTESFASALRSAMRADPDYICVGEMRDLETISTAITAAETGHLVFGTLHTTNSTRSVDRVIDVFSPKEQDQIRAMVSESLRGVISQQLIPRADGRGRVPALEILFANPAVANLIRERKTFNLVSVLQTGSNQGMVMMDDSITQLVQRHVITREEGRFRAENPDRFK